MNPVNEWVAFAEVFADVGKLIHPSWISKDGDALSPLYSYATQLCRFVEEREFSLRRRLIFGLLDSMKVRAVARVRGEVGYIGVSVGTGVLLLHTFARVLCEPTMFPNIGHPQLEKERTTLPYVPSNAWNLDIENSPIPFCSIRMRAGVELASLAFSFLIAHEVTHVEQGHLSLLSKLGQCEALEEGVVSRVVTPALVRQALELIADFHGATRILRRCVQVRQDAAYDHLLGAKNRRALRTIYANPRDAVYFVMFSIAMTWRILDIQSWDNNTLATRSHPPVPARQTALMLNVAHHLKEIVGYGVPAEEADALIQKAFLDAHVAYLKITAQPNTEQTTAGLERLAKDEKTQQHLYALLMSLPEVTTQLKEHAWGWPGVQVAAGAA
jgi:hypothetical protein